MADILIRGMEMPKDGRKHTAVLQFLEDGKCRAIVEYSKSYDDRSVKVFEAVPLPKGHGRLGDLDKLEDAFIRYYLEQERNNNLVFAAVEIKQRVADMIGDWPTIVPAEGGEEDG